MTALRRPRRRTGIAVMVALAVLVVLVAAGVAWRSAPFGETAPVGTLRAMASPVSVAPRHEGAVVVPTARIEIAVGDPFRDADGRGRMQVDAGDPVALERGTTYLPIRWTVGTAPGDPLLVAPAQKFALRLRVGDTRYDLGADAPPNAALRSGPALGSTAVALVVAEEDLEETLEAEVVYDGLTQVLDLRSGEVDAGAAAWYYADAGARVPAPAPDCPLFEGVDDDTGIEVESVTCSIAAPQVTPYLGGRGWADDPARPWTVVDVDVAYGRFARQVGSDRSVVVRRTSSEVSVDGERAEVLSVYRDSSGERLLRRLAFVGDGTPERLVLSEEAEHYELPRDGERPPPEQRARLSDEVVVDLRAG